jgi:hypothetical protein
MGGGEKKLRVRRWAGAGTGACGSLAEGQEGPQSARLSERGRS